MRAIILFCCAALAAFPASAEPEPHVTLDLTVPADETDPRLRDAAVAIFNLADRSVVDLRASFDLAPDVAISALTDEGAQVTIESCPFGPLDGLARLDLPLRDNHLIVEAEPGDPNRHAANAVFCEYAPENLASDAGNPERLTVRGCFLALNFSIPTAKYVLLRPLPADACGLHR